MKLVFLGAPGVGKGTQAKLFATKAHLAHISTGEMLRDAAASGTELGRKAKSIMEQGQLVPDDVMVDVIRERISKPDCKDGYILDGFPRTVEQAVALDKMLRARGEKLSDVVLFEVSDGDLKQRLENRRGEEARADDSLTVQKKRIEVYLEKTKPLIEYYEPTSLLRHVDASGSIEEVAAKLERVLRR